ncbi:MAG: O-antigen ligase family protein [Bacillota bacterium]
MKSNAIMNGENLKPSRLIYFTFPYIIIILLNLKTVYFRYMAFGFVLMIVAAFILANKELLIKKKYFFLFWFITAYSLIGVLYGDPIQIVKNVNMFILSLAPFFIFDWVFSPARIHKRKKNAMFLLKVMTPILLYTVVATLYYLFSNPYIARYMANFDPSRGIDASMGINVDLPTAIGGGYILIYGVFLLPPVFLFLAKSILKKPLARLCSLGIAAFLLYFIIKSGFATAFILSIAGCTLTFLLLNKQKLISRVIIILSVFWVSLIFLNEEVLSEIIHSITNLLPYDSIIAVRLNEIVPALYASANDSSFSNRLHGLEKSWTAFIENPFLGVGYKVGFDYMSVAAFTGLHTEWLDMLAQYGLFLGVPLLLFIGITFNELIKLFIGTSMEQVIKLVVVIIFLVGFLNPILNTSIFIIALLFIPSLLMLVLSKKGTNGN